jgi:hypothetical protein
MMCFMFLFQLQNKSIVRLALNNELILDFMNLTVSFQKTTFQLLQGLPV